MKDIDARNTMLDAMRRCPDLTVEGLGGRGRPKFEEMQASLLGLRHGGNTEGADADLTDAQLRALSGHRTANMTVIYARQTMKQRRAGARKRLAARTKTGDLSE